MRMGTVAGSVWATKKSPGLRGQPLLLVRMDGKMIVAVDLVGAGVGEKVLISFGSAARLEAPDAPTDAAIVGIVDSTDEEEYHDNQ